jgi:hypothetical protein
MITIFCGSDTARSRKSFSDACNKLMQAQESELIELTSSNLEEKLLSSSHEQSLFASKLFYSGENILSKKKNREILLKYEDVKSLELFIWEEQMEPRFVKTYLKKSKIDISDIPSSIWKLLDTIVPGSKSKIIPQLDGLISNMDEHLILYMIQKRTKELILINSNFTGGKKMADWQIDRLKKQAKAWKKDQLLNFYSKLFTIEKSERLGSTSYTIKQSLEILFCFYL